MEQQNPLDENVSVGHPKGPIFHERGDGLGWTFNFDRPISYVILFSILAIALLVGLIGCGAVS